MKPLFECPNPLREFKIGKLFIMTQWAKDIWERDVNGVRETYYLKIKKVDNGSQKALNIILWRLSLYITII